MMIYLMTARLASESSTQMDVSRPDPKEGKPARFSTSQCELLLTYRPFLLHLDTNESTPLLRSQSQYILNLSYKTYFPLQHQCSSPMPTRTGTRSNPSRISARRLPASSRVSTGTLVEDIPLAHQSPHAPPRRLVDLASPTTCALSTLCACTGALAGRR